jgi:AcrR family transcriptional regulator
MSAAKAAKKASRPDLLVLALEMVADHGWSRLSMVDLAARAGSTPAAVYRELGGRSGVLRAMTARIDEAMLEIDRVELDGLPPRDRVFELMMRRFDAMAPFRAGLIRLAKDARQAQDLLLATACRLDRSLTWLQDAAGLPCHGLRPLLQRRVLLAVYLNTLRIWCGDDSADLARTMAALDKQLRRVESIAGLAAGRTTTADRGTATDQDGLAQPA